MNRIVVCALVPFLLVPVLGCGDGKASVAGTLTFDGQAVETATITFIKSEGGLVREGAIVRDGSFTAHVPPGKYKIEVNAQKVVGKGKAPAFKGGFEEVPITAEMFPENYNSKSQLSEEIKSGVNTLKLDLKSKK
jgi:hypothetical protein